MSNVSLTLGSTRRTAPLPLLLAGAWLIAALQLLIQYWAQTGQTLFDTDDAMRLVGLRDLLAGQGWFDLRQPRLQPPIGYDSHWSRLIDAGLAALLSALRAVFDHTEAERLMRTLWPLLWLLPAMAATATIAWRVGGRNAALVALVSAVLAVPGYQQFIPGRIDHHNVQIALTLLVVAATVSANRPWAAALAGSLTALALAVGFESLPYLACGGAAFALRYVFDGNAAAALRRYALALAVGLAVAFLVNVGPAHWGRNLCDAIAINNVAAIATAMAILIAGTCTARSRRSRIAVVVTAGAAALAVVAITEPRCALGPYGMVDARVWPIWLSQVREMQPLAHVFAVNPLTAIAIAAFPAAVLVALLALSRDRDIWRQFAFVVAAAVFLIAALTTVGAIRAYSYAIWLGMPVMAAATVRLFGSLRLAALPARALAAVMLTPLVLSSAGILLAGAAGMRDTDSFARPASRACFETSSYAPLATLPPGLVAADVSFGPFLLALTPHSALAGPYHRMTAGIVAAHDALSLPPDDARKVLQHWRVDYVMICGPRPPDGLAEPALGRSLWSRLRHGDSPPWLEQIPGQAGQAFTAFRVR